MTHVTHVLQSTCHCEKVETPPTRAQSRCFRTSFCTVRWWRLASEVQTTVGTWCGWELNSIFSVCRKCLYVYVISFDSRRWEWENHYSDSDPYLVGCCSYPKDSTCSDSDGCATYCCCRFVTTCSKLKTSSPCNSLQCPKNCTKNHRKLSRISNNNLRICSTLCSRDSNTAT